MNLIKRIALTLAFPALINGTRIGDAHFAPGWTSYQERLQYQTYDITEYLRKENEIRITVGNGWFKGILGFYGQGNHYGSRTALIAMIDVFYNDGTRERISTDGSWGCVTSCHRFNDMIQGTKGHAFHACMKKHDVGSRKTPKSSHFS